MMVARSKSADGTIVNPLKGSAYNKLGNATSKNLIANRMWTEKERMVEQVEAEMF